MPRCILSMSFTGHYSERICMASEFKTINKNDIFIYPDKMKPHVIADFVSSTSEIIEEIQPDSLLINPEQQVLPDSLESDTTIRAGFTEPFFIKNVIPLKDSIPATNVPDTLIPARWRKKSRKRFLAI